MTKINWFSRLFMSWKQIEEFVKKGSNKENEIIKLKTKLEDQEDTIKLLNDMNNLLKNQKDELNNKLSSLEDDKRKVDIKNGINLDKIQDQKLVIEKLKLNNEQIKSELDNLNRSIYDRLKPLNKIDKTFFGKTGNKGKGELGEMQLKNLLQKSGLGSECWIENLQVGKTTVEFAIKSGIEDKWIPIDSKVLESIDEDGHFIIDNEYKNKVMSEAKKVAKYLSKKNTAEYGLLVLQSDSVYMRLYEEFPTLFQEAIENHKIYICSPSSFIQFAWSISHILDIYKRVHNDEKIYDDMVRILGSVTKFSTSLQKTHTDFNIAMSSHYPNIKKQQTQLLKKLNQEGKIKNLNDISDK